MNSSLVSCNAGHFHLFRVEKYELTHKQQIGIQILEVLLAKGDINMCICIYMRPVPPYLPYRTFEKQYVILDT